MKILRNIQGSKISTTTGLIVLGLLILRLIGLDLSKLLNIDIIDLAAGISSIYLIFTKDHNK